MNVEIEGKTLYHIQNRNICSDGSAYDMFLLSDHAPTTEEFRAKFLEDYDDEEKSDEFCTSSEMYKVYYDVL